MKLNQYIFSAFIFSSSLNASPLLSKVNLSGGLCSSENTVVAKSSDGEAFTAIFSDFYLEAQSGVERGHCRLSFFVDGLKGYKMMNLTSYLRGYSYLDKRDSLEIKKDLEYPEKRPNKLV